MTKPKNETEPKVSIFKNFLNGEHITCCSVADVVEAIRRGDYAAAIADYRCASLPMLAAGRYGDVERQAVRRADNSIPRICFASEYRRQCGRRRLVRRNFLLTLEIDGTDSFQTAVNLRAKAAAQPYTLAAFVGANGRSVVIVCRVAARGGTPCGDDAGSLMAEGYRRMHYVYSSQLGVSIPMLTPADDAMCLMSVDDGACYDPNALVAVVDAGCPKASFSVKTAPSGSSSPIPGKTVGDAYRYIFYSCWEHVLSSGLSEDDPLFAEKALAMLAACCRRSGLPEQLCIDRASAIDVINADTDLITTLFRQEYGRSAGASADHLRYVSPMALTAMRLDHFMRKRFCLRRNELTGVVQYKRLGAYDTSFRPVTTEVVNTMAIMAQREGIRVWARDMKERVNSTLVDTFNPISDYISALPSWDGRDRLSAFAARVPTANPYWAEFFAVWMRSMVAHWMGLDSGHGNAVVPLLVGPQGCGKTSFTKIILPEALREYYNDRIDFRNDNTLMQGMSSFALINIDEFDSYSVRRQPLIKYLISKSEVTAIRPYGSKFSTVRRYASFIATTNSRRPLTDTTGNRRFVCAEVEGMIDCATPVDYGQLYAQIVSEIRRGLPVYLDDDATRRLAVENSRFIRLASLDDILRHLVRQPSPDEPFQELTAAAIADIVRREYPQLPQYKASAKEVGRYLTAMNFENRHSRKGTCYTVCINQK